MREEQRIERMHQFLSKRAEKPMSYQEKACAMLGSAPAQGGEVLGQAQGGGFREEALEVCSGLSKPCRRAPAVHFLALLCTQPWSPQSFRGPVRHADNKHGIAPLSEHS